MSEEKDILILAIESSCDETAAAVVKNGREVLSNVISSQIALHTLYGGVVPEIASRKHIEKINQVIREALKEASMTLEEMTAIAVTYGPGLVGALLVGVAEAKAIAYAAKKPLVGVHHIEGHVSANFIEHPDLEPPFVCLIVSGTTPPYRVWRAIWEEITLDRTSLPFFTTAAAVSSQELSMARIYTSSSVLRIFMIVSKPLSGFTLRQSPVPWTSRPGLF